MPEKYCFKCHNYKSHTLFDVLPKLSKCPTCPRDHLCHVCRVRTEQELVEAEAKKRARAAKRLQRQRSKVYAKHHLSLEDFEIMFAFQHGRCAICNDTMASMANYKRHMLYIDHDHGTGQVRGLLCTRCNQGLGFFRDAPHLLARARTYLLESRYPIERPTQGSLFDPPPLPTPEVTPPPLRTRRRKHPKKKQTLLQQHPSAPQKAKRVVDYSKLAKLIREVKAHAALREKKPPLFPKKDS